MITIHRMPFDIIVTREFSAAHALRFPDGTIEPLHGHNSPVAVTVSAAELDPLGVVMDFHELQRLLDGIIMPMHNRHLNELDAVHARANPSAENVAMHIGWSLNLRPTLRPGKSEGLGNG